LNNQKFNDRTDFDTQCDPGYIHEKLCQYNVDNAEGTLNIEKNDEKKWLKIIREDKENPLNSLVIKVKIIALPPPEEGEE